MATEFTQDSVLHFIQSKGGTVKNSDLLFHFKTFLRDPEKKAQHREAFKKFVNSVATVRQEDGVAYVVLKKKFKGHVPGDTSSGEHPSKQVARKPDQAKRRDRNPEKPSWQNQAEITAPLSKPPQKDLKTHATQGELTTTAEIPVLPAAGILNINNNVQASFIPEHPLQSSSPYAPGRRSQQSYLANNFTHDTQPAAQGGTVSNQNSDKVELSLPDLKQIGQYSSTGAKLGQPKEPVAQQRDNYCPPTQLQPKAAPHKAEELPQQKPGIGAVTQSVNHHPVTRSRARHRQSYKTAVSYDADFDEEEDQKIPRSAGGTLQLNASPEQMGRTISSSSTCISDPPTTLSFISYTPPLTIPEERNRNDSLPESRPEGVPVIFIQEAEPELEAFCDPRQSLGMGRGPKIGQVPGDAKTVRSSMPFEEYCTPSPDRAEFADSYQTQNHHNQQLHLNPSAPNLQPELESGFDPVPAPGLGSVLDSVVTPGLSPGLDSVFGVGLRPKHGPGAGLSSSHSSLFPPSSEEYYTSDWPMSSSPRSSGCNSSDESLHTRTAEAKVQEMLQRAKETKLLARMHRAERKSTTPWHHSTGHLLEDNSASSSSPWHGSPGRRLRDDDEDEKSSDGSTSSVALRPHSGVARHISSRLRSRLCRSLGAGLDQPFAADEEEARGLGDARSARQHRLHRISSSLSLRHALSSSSLSSCNTPTRSQSFSDLVEGDKGSGKRGGLRPSSTSTPPDGSKFHPQAVVPLERREHDWLVKGAAGSWPDIYSLFREDPTLLNRRDFISGYTILHWIAKHGDHRVLNTLWYGVSKAGLKLEVDARSACGYTPLHLAAIHGHKKMMRLLVQKFKANVALRDTSGKKPWQYVGRNGPIDSLQLLGAPQYTYSRGGEAGSQHLHHSSSSAGRHHKARPITMSGTMRVKRSSSIAAFLKHKSLLRFHGHQSDSSV